ncbi:MAG: CoA-binding protein [Desulfobacteraceae bacterium]|jgi:acyl-CoA synthetase (NDP forming)|nr:CoA-binding protein [Desulfobacteraceae bacterium]
MVNFTPLFRPETVAVIGVSTRSDLHPANVIYNKLHLRYPLRVFAVNPKGGRLRNETVYRRLSEIPEPVDLAVIAARADHVPGILEACIRNRVGGATVISGGFAEIGRTDLQERITEMAREAHLPFVGPNCLGIYVPGKLDTFFLPGERLVRPEAGNVALVSQSGGVLVDQMVKFAGQGVGLSLGVSIGNKAMVRELDLLEYLAADESTDVIAFYVEGFGPGEGRRFAQQASRCSKPVVVLKAGKTSEGSRAVSSHTASLAGDHRVFSAVMAQHGIAEANNEYELVSFCEALSCYPRTIEGKVAVVSVSGGHGVLASDACAAHGLRVPELGRDVQEDIQKDLSDSVKGIASLKNPVDLTGSALDDDFAAAVAALSRSEDIDCIILLLLPYSPGITSDLGARLSHIYLQTGKPLVAYVPHVEKFRMLIEGFELNRVPVSSSIEGAVLMVEAMKRCRPC